MRYLSRPDLARGRAACVGRVEVSLNRFNAVVVALCAACYGASAAPATQPAAEAAATRPATTRPAAAVKAVAVQQAVAVKQAVVAVAVRRNFALNIKAQREAQKNAVQQAPDGGTFKLDELVKFSVVDGRIE